jgi:hypothetical protein
MTDLPQDKQKQMRELKHTMIKDAMVNAWREKCSGPDRNLPGKGSAPLDRPEKLRKA